MKIGILTYHWVFNHGANLQTLSTIGYLRKIGQIPIVINWIPKDREALSLKSTIKEQIDCFRSFQKEYYPLSHLCRTVKDIADVIREEGIDKVFIGADTLHYPVVIPFKEVNEIKKLVRKEIEKRERHLNDFISEIDKLPQRKRDDLTEDYINMFRTLVGEDGAKYISANDYKVNSVDTALKYLMSIYYANNTQRLDFNNLLAIEDFRKKLSGNNEIQDLLNLMYMEILSLENQKNSMVEVTDITGKKKNTDKIEITINGRKYMMSKVILKHTQ